MDVEIVTNAVAGGWDPRRLADGLGGSEECVTLLAEALARRGLRVAVYASLPESAPFAHRGVAWWPRGSFDPATRRHALIGFKEPGLWLFPARAEVTVHWSSDVEPALKPVPLGRVRHVVALSAAHAERLAWVPRERLRVIPHGIGEPFIAASTSGAPAPWREREPVLLACSSPDRGLERLLLDWPRIVKAQSRPLAGRLQQESRAPAGRLQQESRAPAGRAQQDGELRLAVAYGFPRIPPSPWRAHIEHLLTQPGIVNLGCIAETALADWMRRARYWVHPLNNPAAELFCLSAVKAQALGALPVTQHVADSGLRDTVREYIPYSAFLAGSTTPQPNPAARGDLPLSWDEVVRRWWLPLLTDRESNEVSGDAFVAPPLLRGDTRKPGRPPVPERGAGDEVAKIGGAA